MKKLSLNWAVKQFVKSMENGVISFDYPIQREGNQWDNMQKSLLIHSLAIDFPVPALYSIVEPQVLTEGKKPVNVYKILDGKQRLTNIRDFLSGEYALHEDTPKVVLDDGVSEEEYGVAGKMFDELHEDVQDKIMSYSLQIYKMEDITDEQIEDLFFRLNNGTPLSKQQKSKAKMGAEWAKKIQTMVNHNLIQEKCSFTKLQIRKADHETAILQTMMLIDEGYEWNSISSNEVFDYAQTFKEDSAKDLIVNRILSTMDYLDKAFQKKETVLLKKVHFPMTMLTAMEAMNNGVAPIEFNDWANEFKGSLKNKDGYIETDYKEYGGAGSVKKYKTEGRINSMGDHLDSFFNPKKKFESVEDVSPVEKKITEAPEEVNTFLEAMEEIDQVVQGAIFSEKDLPLENITIDILKANESK